MATITVTAQCRWCRATFVKRRHDQAYCTTAHSNEADKLELKRSRRLYRALYHWRYNRKTAGQLLVFICREIRAWIVEDREMQRLPPPKHDLTVDRGHQRDEAKARQVAREKAAAGLGV